MKPIDFFLSLIARLFVCVRWHQVSLVEKCSPKDLQKLGYAAPKPLKAPKNLDKLPIEKRMKIIQVR